MGTNFQSWMRFCETKSSGVPGKFISPNDTHWGSNGHCTVVRTLQEFCKQMDVLIRTP